MSRKSDPLATYNKKRDFAKTAEPAGKVATRKGKALSFMVQKHDASRLHYDLRLELEGTLKSWAVTRGRASIRPTSASRSAPRTIPYPTRPSKGRSPRGNMAAAR